MMINRSTDLFENTNSIVVPQREAPCGPTSSSALCMIWFRGGVPCIESRLLAQRLGIAHKNFMRRINKYRESFEKLGTLYLEWESRPHSRGPDPMYAMLNEAQAAFALTLSRKASRFVAVKIELMQAFRIFGQPRPVLQSDRINSLKALCDYLPFVVPYYSKSRESSDPSDFCFWKVGTTGDYETDVVLGRRHADLASKVVIDSIEIWSPFQHLFSWISKAQKRHGNEADVGIRTGFWKEVNNE